MAKSKKPVTGVDPDYFEKQRRMLLRRHRHTIYLNDSEVAAIAEYCERFHVRSKSSLMREALMHKILSVLDENPPTLF